MKPVHYLAAAPMTIESWLATNALDAGWERPTDYKIMFEGEPYTLAVKLFNGITICSLATSRERLKELLDVADDVESKYYWVPNHLRYCFLTTPCPN